MATRVPALIQLGDPRVAAQLVDTMHADYIYFRHCRHPDKNREPGAEDNFVKINEAYEVSITSV